MFAEVAIEVGCSRESPRGKKFGDAVGLFESKLRSVTETVLLLLDRAGKRQKETLNVRLSGQDQLGARRLL